MSSQMEAYNEVSKLVGTEAVGNARQGTSVKLSEDGNFLFIGGDADKSGIGAVWFYEKVNGVWTQKQKIVPSGYSGSTPNFGFSIAVNPSMTTLIVGAYRDNSGVGASFVFAFDGTTWTQEGDKLVGNDITGTSGSEQGRAVALSADGNTAIVGGPYDGNYIGAAWIFVRTENVWSQQGSKLVDDGYVWQPWQGYAVALTSDGNLAIVGGSTDRHGNGGIFIYLRSGFDWNQVGSKITAVGDIADGTFVTSLALSGDDQTLVLGGYGDNYQTGAVWILKRNGNTFTQFGNKLVGKGATSNSNQGWSVAVNKLGTLVAVGSCYDSSTVGAVFMYHFNGTNYNQLGNKIVANNAVGYAYQGRSVAVDGSGSQLLFGGWNDNGTMGAAWIYANTTHSSLKLSASIASLQSSRLEVTTVNNVVVVAAVVAAAVVVVLSYFLYCCRAHNKHTTNEVPEMSQLIDESKDTLTAGIQIEELEEENEEKDAIKE